VSSIESGEINLKLYHAQAESFGTVYDRFLVAKDEGQAKDIAIRMDIYMGFNKSDIDVNEVEVEGYVIQPIKFKNGVF
jgi:hypothetical protein